MPAVAGGSRPGERAKRSPTVRDANDPLADTSVPREGSCFIAAMVSFFLFIFSHHAARLSRARPTSWRRGSAAVCAAALAFLSSAGPLAVAAAAAGSPSVLGQAQGSNSAPSPSGSLGGSSSAGSNGSASLDPKADFNAPGVEAGRRLIAWAKAGAMVLGTLGLIGGTGADVDAEARPGACSRRVPTESQIGINRPEPIGREHAPDDSRL